MSWASGNDGEMMNKPTTETSDSATSEGVVPAMVDAGLGLRLAGGDQALADEVFRMLLSELPKHRGQINDAFADRNAERLAAEVHALCGNVAYCGVPALKSASDALHRALRDQDTARIGVCVEKLNREIERLLESAR